MYFFNIILLHFPCSVKQTTIKKAFFYKRFFFPCAKGTKSIADICAVFKKEAFAHRAKASFLRCHFVTEKRHYLLLLARYLDL